MKGNKIGFYEEIWKIIPELSLLPLLIWSTDRRSRVACLTVYIGTTVLGRLSTDLLI